MDNKNIDYVFCLQDDTSVIIEKQCEKKAGDSNERYRQLLKNESEK